MQQIYINGRFLTQETTGVQRVAEEIVKVLDGILGSKILPNYKFTILTPRNTIKNLNLKNIKIKSIGYLTGHAWEQFDLPFFTKNKLLINFCNTGPLYKKNQVIYIHDTAIFDAPEGYSIRFIKVYRKIFKSITKNAKQIITVSDFSKMRLIHYFPIVKNKISYSYLGVEHIKKVNHKKSLAILEKFKLDKYSYFLTVSSSNPNKNFKVISEMLEKSPSIEEEFVIVGGNATTVFGEGNKLSKRIKHLGYVSDEELITLYKFAKGFIFPSKYEGFGLPPIEALNQGCPVISSRCASLPEVLQDKAIYFDYENYNSLYKAIDKLKSLEINREANTNFVQNLYSWRNTTEHLINVISNL